MTGAVTAFGAHSTLPPLSSWLAPSTRPPLSLRSDMYDIYFCGSVSAQTTLHNFVHTYCLTPAALFFSTDMCHIPCTCHIWHIWRWHKHNVLTFVILCITLNSMPAHVMCTGLTHQDVNQREQFDRSICVSLKEETSCCYTVL